MRRRQRDDDRTVDRRPSEKLARLFFCEITAYYSQESAERHQVSVVGFLGDLGYPLTSGMLSGVTSPDHQGFLFSLLGLVESAGTLFSGLGLNTLYSATVGWMKGFVFLLTAILCLLCVPLYTYYLVASKVKLVQGQRR